MGDFLSSGIEPSLIHAVEVQIQRLDVNNTMYDDVFREPSVQAQYKPVQTIICQIHWVAFEKMNMDRGGDLKDFDGWITMRKSDFEDIEGGLFKKSDKIISVDGEPMELYIQTPDRKGHYTEAKLVRFFFKDRNRGFGGE
ncbi:hypothetical protein MASR1M48_17410 [Lactococcus petauri]